MRRQGLYCIRNIALVFLLILAAILMVVRFRHDVVDNKTGVITGVKSKRLEPSTSDHCKQNLTNPWVEDLLSLNIPEFEKNYKNPCFYDTCSSLGTHRLHRLRCLPYFHVLGVDKSGSTDLFFRIIDHPQIVGNDGIFGKETMWWSWKRYGQWLKKSYWKNETFDDYLNYFENASSYISRNVITDSSLDDTDFHPIITGDGTPMDFWDFSGWTMIPQNTNLTEPSVLTPHLLKHVNPNVKLIIILRNPVDRLYSDYLFLGLGTSSARSFSKAVNSSLSYFNTCSKQKGEKACLFDRKLHLAVDARFHVSMYSVYLREWLKVFPSKQILILRNEDYAKDIKGNLKKVYKFLDVVDLPEETLVRIASKRKAYKTAIKRKSGPMFKETRVKLEHFFAKYNEELANMLNDTKFTWLDRKIIPGVDYKDINEPRFKPAAFKPR